MSYAVPCCFASRQSLLTMPARTRICPGRFFADEIVWLAIASMLHTLRISKPALAAGAKDAEVRWCSGLVRYVPVRYGLAEGCSIYVVFGAAQHSVGVSVQD